MKRIIAITICLTCLSLASAQDIGVGETEILSVREREWDIYGTVHTNGLGLGVRFGRQHSIKHKSGFDVEWTYHKLMKEQRGKTSYTIEGVDNRSFVYGKTNSFCQLRVGYGYTRILNTKPYWGGLQTGYFFYGGVSLGISIPVYLYILHPKDTVFYMTTERYNVNIHNLTNIYGRAPLKEGLKDIVFHPGLYLKTGLSFDFSRDDAKITALDFGLAVDAYYKPVEKMAFAHKQYVLITGFISIHLGKRLTHYE